MSPITSCVRSCGGVPQLFVNGAPVEGAAYMTYLTEHSHYEAFAKVGYRLFSIPLFFATHSINAGAQNPPSQPVFLTIQRARIFPNWTRTFCASSGLAPTLTYCRA